MGRHFNTFLVAFGELSDDAVLSMYKLCAPFKGPGCNAFDLQLYHSFSLSAKNLMTESFAVAVASAAELQVEQCAGKRTSNRHHMLKQPDDLTS